MNVHNSGERRNAILNIASSNYSNKREILDRLAFDDDIDLSPEEVEVLRSLLKDDSRYIRSQTASLLARFSKWPDAHLLSAFDKEIERSAKITMFQTILELRGVPFHVALRETEHVEREGVEPSLEMIDQIVLQDK